MKQDLLGLKDLSAEEIQNILETAKTMKAVLKSPMKKTPHLQGKTVVNLFYENSTRTRTSFELAAKYMSANAANITASGSSVAKGETLIDTANTINAMGTDILVMRQWLMPVTECMSIPPRLYWICLPCRRKRGESRD